MKLSTSPDERFLLKLEQRKSFSFAVIFRDQNGKPVNITGSSLSFDILVNRQKLRDPEPAILPADVVSVAANIHEPVFGFARFNVQASQLDLPAASYPYTITLRTGDGYSVVVAKGEVELQMNPELGSVDDVYADSGTVQTLDVTLRGLNVVSVIIGAQIPPKMNWLSDEDKEKLDTILVTDEDISVDLSGYATDAQLAAGLAASQEAAEAGDAAVAAAAAAALADGLADLDTELLEDMAAADAAVLVSADAAADIGDAATLSAAHTYTNLEVADGLLDAQLFATALANGNVRTGTVEPYYTQGPPKIVWDDAPGVVTGPHTHLGGGLWWPYAGEPVIGVKNHATGQYFTQPIAWGTGRLPRWHNLTLLNNWANYPDYAPARVTKTADGIVKVTGLIKSVVAASATLGTVIATLPPGFRPAGDRIFTSIYGGDGNVPGSVEVKANGDIVYRLGSIAWYTLEAIAFPASDVAPDAAWTNATLSAPFTRHADTRFPAPSFWKDTNGIVWQRGVVVGSPQPTVNQTPIFTTPVGFRSFKEQHRRTTGNDGFGFIYALPSGVTGWGVGSTTTNLYSLDGFPYADIASPLVWNQLSFGGSWTNYDAAQTTYPTAAFARTPAGLVLLRGLINGGVMSTVISNLPAGCRPSQTLLMPAVSNAVSARCDIDTNGGILLAGSTAWFALDGICFVAEQ